MKVKKKVIAKKKVVKVKTELSTEEVQRLITLSAATMYMNREIDKILSKINK
jgi:hypothetical protein